MNNGKTGNKLLLALDAALPARHAAETVWRIAATTGCAVEAVCVVNPDAVQEFIGGTEPGLVAVDTFLDCREQILNQLRAIADSTAAAFEEDSRQRGMPSKCSVIVGDPLEQLGNLSDRFDLVVVGHGISRLPSELTHSTFAKLSLAEQIAHSSTAPLLVVQQPGASWNATTILLSPDHINELYITETLGFSRALDVDPEILLLCSGVGEEGWVDLTHDLRQANPDLKDVTIGTIPWQIGPLWSLQSYWDVPSPHPFHLEHTTIPVIPTRKVGERRITLFGNSVTLWVRYLTEAPAMLFFPEERSGRFSWSQLQDSVITGPKPALLD